MCAAEQVPSCLIQVSWLIQALRALFRCNWGGSHLGDLSGFPLPLTRSIQGLANWQSQEMVLPLHQEQHRVGLSSLCCTAPASLRTIGLGGMSHDSIWMVSLERAFLVLPFENQTVWHPSSFQNARCNNKMQSQNTSEQPSFYSCCVSCFCPVGM